MNLPSTCPPSSDDLTPEQVRQLKREAQQLEKIRGDYLRNEVKQQQGEKGSQTTTGRGLLRLMVPATAKWLELHIAQVEKRSKRSGTGWCYSEIKRIATWVDFYTIAHIGLATVLDAVGRGQTFRTPINTVQAKIGKHLEDQAFMSYMADADPFYFTKLQRYYLNDPVRRYDKKVYAMKFSHDRDEKMDFKFMSEENLIRVGALVLKAIMSIPADSGIKEGFFERKMVSKGRKKQVYYLAFSQSGIIYRDAIQRMAVEIQFKPAPMVCPPLPWSLKNRGGYLTPPPSPFGDLVHGFNPTIPSDSAIDALNRLQAEPYNVNNYILDVQMELLKTANIIGSFRAYEADSWKDEHFPRYTSEFIASLEKGTPEHRKVMKQLRDAYHNQKLCEKDAILPGRIVRMASELRDETFYTPWFFDSRLRLYPASDLSVVKGDFVKALLVTANPKPITEDTRRELLIAIATSGAFDKVDKKDYYERMKWAEEFIASPDFKDVVLNPLTNSYWKEADEPFQFLAYCEEFYSLFISGERTTTRVWIGRDMSCSGIQFLSSLIGDEKAMRFTNVIPSDTPQDAYGEVARVARELLRNPSWLKEQVDKRTKKDEMWNANNPQRTQREIRTGISFNIDDLQRAIVKKQVMVTGYGGTYQSKHAGIKEALKDKNIEIHPGDVNILVRACVDGMEVAFPSYSELNKWFKQLASAACKSGADLLRWVSPNGSIICQDYREPLFARVATHAASGGHYAKIMTDEQGGSSIQTGWGDVKPSKHGSAIAANVTHSLDACMIQNGINRLADGVNCVSLHDCLYTQPGYIDQVIPHFRESFYGVVTTPILENLIEENNLEGVMDVIDRETLDVSCCKTSPFMFS